MSNSTTSISDLKNIFTEAFGLEPDSEIENLEYRGIPEWDSVAHMRLIRTLEQHFDIMMSTEEVLGLSSFKRARAVLEAHGIQFDA